MLPAKFLACNIFCNFTVTLSFRLFWAVARMRDVAEQIPHTF